jgi:DNA-binding GntR family transcriptional regulator
MKPSSVDALELRPIGLRSNVRDEIVRTLQAAVISGDLQPGVVYSAPSLAAQFGVSATPVREAMLDLVKEGLVEAVRNKGFRVTELSDVELDEITELRALIEVPTIGKIAERGVPRAVMAQLRQLAKEIESASEAKDLVAHNKADLEFHLLLLGVGGNEILVRTVRTLRTRSRLYGMAALAAHGELTPTSREHAELLALIRKGDAAAAEALMLRHIGHVRGAWATGAGD